MDRYLCGNSKGINIYSPEGERLTHIEVPGNTTNCTFGGPTGSTLFITSGGSLYKIELHSNPEVIEGPLLETARAIEIKWASQSGRTYQPQYSTGLDDWVDLGDPLVGTGNSIRIYERSEDFEHRFYRIVTD
ncbi:MAG TPA: hypothetical protein EYQ50_25980 [Verrucomicrobiales bacterium]|nr:hypothetical protein [Verrucomicrobiales bacterium]HIL69290.1 hypothetical protein [Verrucomicrobiota bacterium]